MNSNILVKSADPEFRVHAFAEFTARAQERFANFLSAITDIPNYISDDPDQDSYTPLTQAEVIEIRSQIMTDYNISPTVVSLTQGYATTESVLDALIQDCHYDLNFVDDSNPISGSGVIHEFAMTLSNAAGTITKNVNLTAVDIGDQLQSGLHSIVCLNAAASAYASAVKDDISSAIAIFNDKINDVFTNSHADVSSSISFFKGLLQENLDPNQFLTSIMDRIGSSEEANAADDDVDVSLASSDVYAYTGASPAGALDFSSGVSAVTTIARTAAKVVVNVVKGVVNAIGALFKKIGGWLYNVVIDPNDLEVINDKGFGTVDGFFYQHRRQVDLRIDFPFSTTAAQRLKFIDDLQRKLGHWIAVKTKFSEMLFRLNSYTFGVTYMDVTFDAQYKPRILNHDAVLSALPTASLTSPFSTQDEVEMFLDNLEALGSKSYAMSKVSEADAFRGLLDSLQLDNICAVEGWNQLSLPFDDRTLSTTYLHPGCPGNIYGNVPSTITNLDWVKQLSGWNGSSFGTSAPYTYHSSEYLPDAEAFDGQVDTTIEFWVRSVLISWCSEYVMAPGDALFVPYSNNHTTWNPMSYSIKTDAQNQEAFNNFIAIAIIVLVVAIVATSALVLIKRLARARYFKYAQRQGQLDNAMWNGKTLSRREQRMYVRAKKRVDRSNLFSSALQNPLSAQNTDASVANTDSAGLQRIHQSIVGYL